MNMSLTNWISIILNSRFEDNLKLEVKSDYYIISLGQNLKFVKIPIQKEFYLIPNEIKNCSEFFSENGKSIPLPSVKQSDSLAYKIYEDRVEFNFDVLGVIYWVLNRIEEINSSSLDKYERFQGKKSHAHKHGYLNRPIIDEFFIELEYIFQFVWPEIQLKEKKFRTIVSHDVDQPSRFAFRSFKSFLKESYVDFIREKKLKTIFIAPIIYLFTNKRLLKIDPANTFDWIMDFSEKNNLKSSFYFIPGGNHPNDGTYTISHPAMHSLIKRINSRGHELGIHPSFECFRNYEKMNMEMKILKNIFKFLNITNYELGGRMHYLRWAHPETLKICNDIGMVYDGTLGYSDLPGFRCGTCIDYQAFDPIQGKVLNIIIRPLIVMECTVISKRYMDSDVDTAFEIMKDLKEKCIAVGGNFNLLWHNSELIEANMKELYMRIVSYRGDYVK